MKKIILALCLLFAVGVSWAQGLKDVRINEVLVFNENGIVDSHGEYAGWIELYNSGHTSANVGGAFLTVKKGDAKLTYRIPKNDARTLIAPQGYLMFYASGSSNRGTFYTNFKLDSTGYLALLEQNGQTVVDKIDYKLSEMQPDVTIGRIWEDTSGKETPEVQTLKAQTPLQSNNTEDVKPQDEIFKERDPSGFVMALTAMSVVFTALIALYLVFKQLGKFMTRGVRRQARAAAKEHERSITEIVHDQEDINAEVIAAISVAMRQWEEDMQEMESTVLTINRVARTYSPWSSKIYTLTTTPTLKK